QPPMPGEPALATVELVFRLPGPDGVFNTADDIGAPLPDDRFTLTVNDDIIDKAGNHLDGESNASEPLEFLSPSRWLPALSMMSSFTDIIDKAGNHLDGESNASEPLEFPTFPTGDTLPGGAFVGRFTIDSR